MAGISVEAWARINLQPPPSPGYYRVQDFEGRQGIAFRHANHEWTAIEGPAQKPYDLWSAIR